MWRAGTGQPRVHQQLRHLQPLCRRLPQHAADQTLGLRRKPIRQAESPATDLGEQHSGSRVLKWVSSNEHGVQGHAQTPDVCGAARVRAFPVGQQLRADVGGAAMSVCQRVVIVVAMQEDGVIEAEQRKFCPAGKKRPNLSVREDGNCNSSSAAVSPTTHLCLSVKTNRRSFRSRRITPCW